MGTADLLSAHEVAIRLSLSEDTVLRWARSGKLPAHEVDGAYWFRAEDIAAYANEHPDSDPAGDGGVNDLIRPDDQDARR